MKTRKQLATRIRKLQDTMDMRDWTFVLDGSAPHDKSRLAEVSVVSGSRVGRIAVSAELMGMNDVAITYVLVHELLHAYLWELGEHHDALANKLRSISASEQARASYEKTEERTVDALALVIATLMHGKQSRRLAVAPIASLYWRE